MREKKKNSDTNLLFILQRFILEIHPKCYRAGRGSRVLKSLRTSVATGRASLLGQVEGEESD